jgi:hypothetical protein
VLPANAGRLGQGDILLEEQDVNNNKNIGNIKRIDIYIYSFIIRATGRLKRPATLSKTELTRMASIDNTRFIPLTQGKLAIVDFEDYEAISKYKWCIMSTGYAAKGALLPNGKRGLVLMHRVIMNTPNGMDTDHVNGDKLDNRRCNLRICSRSQNMQNQKAIRRKTSKYKGVCWHKAAKKWLVQVDGNFIGHFSTEIDAALSYNWYAKKYFGEFAKLNRII